MERCLLNRMGFGHFFADSIQNHPSHGPIRDRVDSSRVFRFGSAFEL